MLNNISNIFDLKVYLFYKNEAPIFSVEKVQALI